MTSALTAFAIAVSGTSLICFALMTRAERRRNRRRTSEGGSDGGTYAGDNPGSHFWNWFGGTIPHPIAPAIRAEVTAGEAGTAEAAAIDDARHGKETGILIYRNRASLDSFQCWDQFGIASKDRFSFCFLPRS